MNDERIEVQVAANIAQLGPGMQQAVQTVQSAAAGIQGSLGKMQSLAGTIGGAFGTLGAILAGGKIFKDCVAETIKWNSEAMKLARGLGITTEAASVLNVALGDIYSSQEEYLHASQMMTRQLNTGGEGFKKLGISVKDAQGNLKPTGDLMQEVLDKLNGLNAGTDRNAAGMAIFGRSWGEAQKLLKLNAQVMEEAKEKAERLNLVVGPEGVAMTKAYKAAMNDVGDVMTSLKVQVGSAVLPALIKLGTFFGDIGPGLAKTLEYAIKGVTQVLLVLKAVVETLTIILTALIDTMIIGFRNTAEMVAALLMGQFSQAVAIAKQGAREVKNEWEAAGQGIADSWKNFAKSSAELWTNKVPETKATKLDGAGGNFDPNKGKETSAFDSLSKAWEKQKALLISQGAEAEAYGRAAELAFWQSKLSTLQKGSEDWVKATLKADDLRKQLDDEAQERRKAQLADDLQAAKEDSEKRLAIAQGYYEEMKAAHGTGSKITIDAHKKIEEEQQRHAAKMKELARVQAEGILAEQLGTLDVEEESIRLRAQLGEISAQEELAGVAALEERRFTLKQEALQRDLALEENDRSKRLQIKNQLEEDERQHQLRLKQIKDQARIEESKKVDSFFMPMRQAMQDSVTDMLSGAETFSQGMKGIWKGLGASFDQGIAKMVTDWSMGQVRMLALYLMNKAKEGAAHAATERAKTGATSMGVIQRLALETWGAIKSVALAIWTGMKWIAIKAYEAAAGAYSAIASIPYVGPFLAPVMSAAALVAVLGMGSKIASASGGFDIPAGVNPLVQAHAQEMILPANLSQGFRKIIADQSGGGGSQGSGDVHVHINAVDAKGVERLFLDNQGPLAKALKSMARDGRV